MTACTGRSRGELVVDDQIWQYSVISDISDQVGYLHRISESWHWFQAGYIRPKADISDVSDISGFQSGSRALALVPGQTYPI
jgi:hypothetical protein